MLEPEEQTMNVAQAALNVLGEEYFHLCFPNAEGKPTTREADEIGYACLLVCHDHGRGMGPGAREVILACRRAAVLALGPEWLNSLVWDCCKEILETGIIRSQDVGGRLFGNLTHSRSDVRLYIMELVSLIKPSLEPAPVAKLLLKNVADTLGDWDFALGLAASLYPDVPAFIEIARAYEPESYADQYKARLDSVEKSGFGLVLYRHAQLEVKTRRRIEAAALNLSIHNSYKSTDPLNETDE